VTEGREQPAPSAAPTEEGKKRGYRHGKLVVTLLVIACVLAPIAGVSVWVKNQVTNTDRYVRTVKPLASNSAIQAAIADNVTTTLFNNVDARTKAQDALPPRAQFLAGPLANGLRPFVRNTTMQFLASDAFQRLWVELNRRAHKQLVKVLTGQGTVVQTANGQVQINLAPVLARVETRLHNRGINVFDRIPPESIKTNFVILNSEQLQKAQRGVRLLKTLAIALPLLVLALFAAAIALLERRRRTLLQAGLGLAASMAVLGILLTVGRSIYLDYVTGPNLPHDAAAAFYDTIIHYLRLGLRIIAAVGLLVAAGAWVSGPSRWAVAIRSRFGSAVGWAQGETGAAASPFGHWVAANKKALRVAAILVPLGIALLWNSPSVTVLIVLGVIVVVLLLAIELFGRAPSAPGEVGTPTSAT
jgi:hypothetical protein